MPQYIFNKWFFTVDVLLMASESFCGIDLTALYILPSKWKIVRGKFQLLIWIHIISFIAIYLIDLQV